MPDMTAVRDEILMRLDTSSIRYVELRLAGAGPMAACEQSGLTTQQASLLEEDPDVAELFDIASMCRRTPLPDSAPSGATEPTGGSSHATPAYSSPPVGSFFSRGQDAHHLCDLALKTLIDVATSSSDPRARTAAASALLKHAGRMAGPRGKQAVQRLLMQADARR